MKGKTVAQWKSKQRKGKTYLLVKRKWKITNKWMKKKKNDSMSKENKP